MHHVLSISILVLIVLVLALVASYRAPQPTGIAIRLDLADPLPPLCKHGGDPCIADKRAYYSRRGHRGV
jgi:hypothetical protein